MFRSKRRYPRIAVDFQVEVDGMGAQCTATSTELGGGGMALKGAAHLPISLPVEVTFDLPGYPRITVHAVIWWKDGGHIGLRFDPGDERRLHVERFVAHQLKLAEK